MTFDDRVRALQPYRLTDRQARFVTTVALHGGYCLRRHYLAFAGVPYGVSVRRFFAQLVTSGLATCERGRADRGYIYHLQRRGLYRALGEPDNRNRRPASFAAIARKLMLLDFVLAQSQVAWLATEDDKVELCTTRFGVPLQDLPHQGFTGESGTSATVRFFTQKLPLGIDSATGAAQCVTLALDGTGESTRRFLLDHVRLLRHVPAWQLWIVAPRESGAMLDAAQAAFVRLTAAETRPPTPAESELTRFFLVRRAVEQHRLADLSVADLNWFRDARSRYTGPAAETRYQRWVLAGEAARTPTALTAEDRAALARGTCRLHELPFSYEQFGDFAGVC